MRCHQLCWFLCDESLLCSFSNRNLGQITEIVYEKQKVTLNDGWAMFLCSKNRVDVHCWDLTVPWGCPPAWICSTLFLRTHELGQDGSSLPWVPTLRVLLPHRLSPASCPSQSAWLPCLFSKESHHNPNLRICSDTSNNEDLVKVLNWVFSYFVGENWGFYFFFNFTCSDWFSSTFGVRYEEIFKRLLFEFCLSCIIMRISGVFFLA